MRSLALFVLFCTLVETAPAEAFSLPPEGGSLNTRRLRRAIRLRRRTLQPCYRRYLQRRTKKMPHTGKVKAHFLIKAGKVSQVTIRTKTFKEGHFLRCLQRVIQGWDLSKIYRRSRKLRRPCTTRETDAGKRLCYDVKPSPYFYKNIRVSTPFSFWPKQLHRARPSPKARKRSKKKAVKRSQHDRR